MITLGLIIVLGMFYLEQEMAARRRPALVRVPVENNKRRTPQRESSR